MGFHRRLDLVRGYRVRIRVRVRVRVRFKAKARVGVRVRVGVGVRVRVRIRVRRPARPCRAGCRRRRRGCAPRASRGWCLVRVRIEGQC